MFKFILRKICTLLIFVKIMFETGMPSNACESISFKLGWMTGTTKLYFDTILNDLDLHIRSQGYEKGRA